MIKEILDFFKKEKGYGFLFLVLAAIYAFFAVHSQQSMKAAEDELQKSAVLEEFKLAEKEVQNKVKKAGSLEEYLKDRPDLGLLANLFSFSIIFLFIVGLVLDLIYFTKPEMRVRFQADRAPPAIEWRFSLLFKFFIWFFLSMIVLSFTLAGFRRFIPFPENFFVLLHTTCAEILSFIVIVWIVKRHGGKLSDLGFRLPGSGWFTEMKKGWTAYVAIIPIFAAVLIVLLVIADLMKYEPPPHPLVPIFLEEETRSQWLVFYSLALAVFFGPLFEEIFFRGFCYPILKSRIGTWGAMGLTSAFFALIHDNSFTFWPIFVLGLGLNYVYEKRGSLLASVTLHVTHNVLFLSYFFLAKDIITQEMGS